MRGNRGPCVDRGRPDGPGDLAEADDRPALARRARPDRQDVAVLQKDPAGPVGERNGVDQLAISTQCGFASEMAGNPIAEESQWKKLEMVVKVADRVWPRP